jgi:hypothetical protein
MQDQLNSLESLWNKTHEYVETKIELVKMKVAGRTAEMGAVIASRVLIWVVVLLMVVVLNTGIAIWLGEVLGKMYYGFFAVAGFYFLLTMILIIFRGGIIKNPVRNMLIKKILE